VSAAASYQLDTVRLAEAISQVQLHRKISDRRLAGEAGLSPSTITRLRHGQKPDADALLSLLHWLGHDVGRLFAVANGNAPAGDDLATDHPDGAGESLAIGGQA